MSGTLVTVEQAAQELNLHPKTVLRYIHTGRLPATRVGKSYRIARNQLEAFAGIASGQSEAADGPRTTCVVDVPNVSVGEAERLATLLNAAAMTGNAATPPLHLQTAFDPRTKGLKVVMIGCPSDVAKLLEMLQLQLRDR